MHLKFEFQTAVWIVNIILIVTRRCVQMATTKPLRLKLSLESRPNCFDQTVRLTDLLRQSCRPGIWFGFMVHAGNKLF